MAYGFDEGKNRINFADYFTYVIDSQAKFDDWVNRVSGNDYSYVAIIGGKGAGENGAYVQTVTNYLTTKTKGIQGFCGAKIEAKSQGNITVFWYSSTPNSDDYFIRDLEAKAISNVEAKVFSACVNLINCNGTAIADTEDAYAFRYCNSLNRCTGYGLSDGDKRNGYGFYTCANLINCNGTGIAKTGKGYAFDACKRLSFCTALASTAKYNNCYVTSTVNETYIIPANGSDTPNGGFNV